MLNDNKMCSLHTYLQRSLIQKIFFVIHCTYWCKHNTLCVFSKEIINLLHFLHGLHKTLSFTKNKHKDCHISLNYLQYLDANASKYQYL